MKPKLIHLVRSTIIGALSLSGQVASQEAVVSAVTADDSFHLAVVTDATGEELKKVGVLASITSEDITATSKKALLLNRNIFLHFGIVDEKAVAEEDILSCGFPAFMVKPPKAPDVKKMIGSMSDKIGRLKEYKKSRSAYYSRWGAFARQRRINLEAFHLRFLGLQAETQAHFDQELAKRRVRDYRRSDISGIIPAITKKLGSQGERYLLLNSDCQDLVEHRKPRRKPFTKDELPSDIIIVTTCTTLKMNPLFNGVDNKIHIVSTVQEGIEWVFRTKNQGKE